MSERQHPRARGTAKSRRKKKDKRPSVPARFAVGAQARVKPGTADLDFPDIPPGG
jgi:hypothetical protein